MDLVAGDVVIAVGYLHSLSNELMLLQKSDYMKLQHEVFLVKIHKILGARMTHFMSHELR